MGLSNIVETKHSQGIEILLKGNKSRFTILGVVLDTTPKIQKIYIRKWLKRMSKKYSNILFIYHCVSESELGNMTLLIEDKNKYPLVYHIVDVSNIIIRIENANDEAINSSFEQVKGYYIQDMQQKELNNNDDEITDDNNESDKSYKESQIKTDKEKIILKRKESKFDKQLEKNKLEEKVELLNEHAEEFKKDFLTDIKERKLMES
jgi:hypothetical protein